MPLQEEKIPDLPSNMQFQSPFLSLSLSRCHSKKEEEEKKARKMLEGEKGETGEYGVEQKLGLQARCILELRVFGGQRFNN